MNEETGTVSILSLVPDALLQTSADAIVAVDLQGVICLWNPGAVRMFGFNADEAIGRSLDLIIPQNLRARHWVGFREVMATGHSRYGEGALLAVPGLTKPGQRISLEFTILMLRDERGLLVGMVSILRDVSKRFEEMRSLQRRLAELTGPAAS
jgi:PAS domain S-box-containing protein